MFSNQKNIGNIDPLVLAKEIIKDSDQISTSIQNQKGLLDNIGLNDYIIQLITSNVCSTIGIKYESNTVMITTIYGDSVKLVKFNDYSAEEYFDFCKTILKIDEKEKYNCSISTEINGVRTRIYAVMPPLCQVPNITISTTKIPPETISNKTISDELFNKIVHSNFIISGASGSGKTYLANYLLNKYIRKDERIALIEEFGELIPPNELSSSIIVPPPKPGKESLLKFVTQQSNLMRLDAFYIGEVKGAEAWPMIVNMASGTRGGCTLHGDNAKHALARLRALCQENCNSIEAIDEFISKSIDYIIEMNNRKIQNIYKLQGTHNKGNFAMQEVAS